MTHRTIVAAALLAASLATGAAAQTTPAAVSNSAPPAKAAPDRRSAAIERRIADLRSKLKITPAQQKPFDDFAQVMRDNAQRMDELVQQRQESANSGTAVDQMHSYTAMAQAHAEDMQRLSTSFATLYDALSSDQKKMADQSFRQFAMQRRRAPG